MAIKHWVAMAGAAVLVSVGSLCLRPAHTDGKAPQRQAEQGVYPSSNPAIDRPFASDMPDASTLAQLMRPVASQDGLPLPVFKATTDGQLQVDAQAREDLERLTLLYGRAEGMARLRDATRDLPPAAQHAARDLYQRYVQYTQAQSQQLQTEQSVAPTLQEARSQLRTLQALRAQYFGDHAAALFAQEERMQQQLLDDAAEAIRGQGLSQDKALTYAQEKLSRELDKRAAVGP
jgi:hypothetical protein